METMNELFAEIRRRGFLVRMLKQTISTPPDSNVPKPTGGWWCDLGTPEGQSDTAYADSAEKAVSDALQRLSKRFPEPKLVSKAGAEAYKKLKNAKPGEAVELTEDELAGLD